MNNQGPFCGSRLNKTDADFVKDAIDIAEQAVKGLHFLHQNGYVHKKIKPKNFLIRRNRRRRNDEPKWICKLGSLGMTEKTVEGESFCSPIERVGAYMRDG